MNNGAKYFFRTKVNLRYSEISAAYSSVDLKEKGTQNIAYSQPLNMVAVPLWFGERYQAKAHYH